MSRHLKMRLAFDFFMYGFYCVMLSQTPRDDYFSMVMWVIACILMILCVILDLRQRK